MIRIGKITVDDIEKAVDHMSQEDTNPKDAVNEMYKLMTAESMAVLKMMGDYVIENDRTELIATAVMSTMALATKYSEERARKQAAAVIAAASLVMLLLSYFLLYLPSIPQ